MRSAWALAVVAVMMLTTSPAGAVTIDGADVVTIGCSASIDDLGGPGYVLGTIGILVEFVDGSSDPLVPELMVETGNIEGLSITYQGAFGGISLNDQAGTQMLFAGAPNVVAGTTVSVFVRATLVDWEMYVTAGEWSTLTADDLVATTPQVGTSLSDGGATTCIGAAHGAGHADYTGTLAFAAIGPASAFTLVDSGLTVTSSEVYGYTQGLSWDAAAMLIAIAALGLIGVAAISHLRSAVEV